MKTRVAYLPFLILGALFAVFTLWPSGNAGGGTVADFLATVTGRGSRVGDQTSLDASGVVQDDPQALADSASLSLDQYALARMVSSEEGISPTIYKIAVAHAARNKTGGRPAATLLAGTGLGSGHFKAQGYTDSDGSKHAGYASTASDPYDDDAAIAVGVLGGTIADVTSGATNFFRPQLQDKLYAEGKVTKDGDTVIAQWTAGGLARVDVDGVDGDELAFFRPGGTASG